MDQRGPRQFHKRLKRIVAVMMCALSVWMFLGCGSGGGGTGKSPFQGSPQQGGETQQTQQSTGTRDATPVALVPEAPGTDVISVEGKGSIDISNVNQGYVTASYTGDSDKAKFRISSGGEEYNYDLHPGQAEVFPLTHGDGAYEFIVFEHKAGTEDGYNRAVSGPAEVTLSNEFGPFLYPNQYVNFTPESAAVSKGAELAQGAADDLGVVERVYNFAVENISYDYDKVNVVQSESGYLPNVDETLSTKKGICFDYAVLMATMLRTQRIPTKLVLGYVTLSDGTQVYHAWISVYIEGQGWVDNIIEFNGTAWVRMDPTLASTSGQSTRYEGKGDQYNEMYYF